MRDKNENISIKHYLRMQRKAELLLRILYTLLVLIIRSTVGSNKQNTYIHVRTYNIYTHIYIYIFSYRNVRRSSRFFGDFLRCHYADEMINRWNRNDRTIDRSRINDALVCRRVINVASLLPPPLSQAWPATPTPPPNLTYVPTRT